MTDVIYEQYRDKVLRYITSKVGDPYLAEDLCGDVILKLYEKADSFDERRASLSTWIFTIARNRLTDYYRTRRVFEEIPETLADEGSVEDSICNAETLEILARGLESLSERERDIIIMRYYSGKTLREAGERLNISYAYVKVLHRKALAELEKFMENNSSFSY